MYDGCQMDLALFLNRWREIKHWKVCQNKITELDSNKISIGTQWFLRLIPTKTVRVYTKHFLLRVSSLCLN